MSGNATRRDFLGVACGALCAGGCGQFGDGYDDYVAQERSAAPPGMDDPTCAVGDAGLLEGPPAKSVYLYRGVQISGKSIWVCRDEQGLFAIENRCTHAGCATTLSEVTNAWECPCHGSRFAFDGHVVVGPAKLPLQRYAACERADGVVMVDTRKKL